MKQSLTIPTSELGLPGSNKLPWFDRFRDYLPKLDELIHRKVADEDRIEYGEELAAALYELSSFGYLVRKERDNALARGYEKYPRPQYHSDAAEALARQFASEEVRLRALVEEREAALKLRFQLNISAAVSYREREKSAGRT